MGKTGETANLAATGAFAALGGFVGPATVAAASTTDAPPSAIVEMAENVDDFRGAAEAGKDVDELREQIAERTEDRQADPAVDDVVAALAEAPEAADPQLADLVADLDDATDYDDTADHDPDRDPGDTEPDGEGSGV